MRSLPEWRGKTDNAAIPPRVQDRVLVRYCSRCAICTRELGPGLRPVFDHIKALINDGENREYNIQPLCEPCHKTKTAADVALKSSAYKKRSAHRGIKKARHPIPGWRRFDGTAVRNPKLSRRQQT